MAEQWPIAAVDIRGVKRGEMVAALALALTSRSGEQRQVSERAVFRICGVVETELAGRGTVAVDARSPNVLVVRLRTRNVVAGRRLIIKLVQVLAERSRELVGGALDTSVAWAPIGRTPRESVTAATELALAQQGNRDLMIHSTMSSRRSTAGGRWATIAQFAIVLFLAYVLPFLVMLLSWRLGFDFSPFVYLTVVVGFLLTVIVQCAEALHAVSPEQPAPAPQGPAAPASAIIAAYLPNEADTIRETLEAFLRQRYNGPLQVILAYNTPVRLPVEDELERLAAVEPRLLLLRVEDSRSKAQNVNAALAAVTGDFVGIFDADHQPMQGAFDRAWRWIASGIDIVQGHCVVRNGDESFTAAMVSVEFEQIYAVSHPGRQRLHGFGVFGGSNGFWRTKVLRETRMNRSFLTEDIESSIRAVREGRVIINDPGLVSRELAPETLGALWKQRLRWAQGWLQVSVRHGHVALVDEKLSAKQRVGMLMLLGWREVFLWLAALMPSLLAFFLVRDGYLKMTSTMLLFTTLAAFATNPVQLWFAYRLGVPEIRAKRWRWFASALFTMFFYQEFKNFLGRVAAIKQLWGERHWAVTARTRSAEEGTR